MVFGNTGMDDKDLFIRAAMGEDVISSMYPNLTLQNLAGRSPLITKDQATKLPSFEGYKQWVMANGGYLPELQNLAGRIHGNYYVEDHMAPAPMVHQYYLDTAPMYLI